ncbi:hypothetical protein ACWOFR_08110 [Carnobacterium gallinarum]|uniref:hypothetical protein n=1 Tax=Carnobacterium gallinarum TaxID=2749 RepID=UPI00055040F9|nr:hypothetical protein [Carnobacterium gallinarum]
MENTTIQKVWAVQNLLFKNEDYQLALELEDSHNRVSLGYILVTDHSPAYQVSQEFGWSQNDFDFYKSLHDAKINCLALV